MTAPETDRDFYRRDRAAHPTPLAPTYKSTVLRAPFRPLHAVEQSALERSGPTFGRAALGPVDHDLIRNAAVDGDALGERIYVHGRVLDENARPVPNALIEIWQANAAGRYAHVKDGYLAPLDPNFSGCGRCMTDAEGRYLFRTIKPGPYPWPNNGSDWRPAHIHLSVFGEAFTQRLITQLYFEGDPLIPLCPIVNTIPDPTVIERLVARLDMKNQEPFDCLAYRFDIVLRGRRQTHFETRPEGA
ncbi:protocatechuate 3,4-dioxygenase subunit beta [Stappia sp.]|uniref:protocatechuate 3,4-dioxygenase subunit beta n=1 Tax=Stappia sp. TaxID=1870903 RepID=UPI0032D97A3F